MTAYNGGFSAQTLARNGSQAGVAASLRCGSCSISAGFAVHIARGIMRPSARTTLSKTVPSVFIGIALTVLPGCFAYETSFVYLESPGVTHRRAPCYDGAPMGVAYEKGGVSFELTLEPHAMSPLKQPYLKLRAPRHAAVSIPEPIAHVRFRGERENQSASVNLKLTPLDWQGPYVEDRRRKSPLAEYRFVFSNLPPINSPGTLELPDVLFDGVVVKSPVFAFERRTYAGTVPLNC